MNMKNKELRKIVWAALLTAISIVLDSVFKIILPSNVGVAFYAIPIIIAGMFLDIKYSLVIAFLGDGVSVLISGDPFYPLFTLGSLMWGLIPPLLLNKDSKLPKIIVVVLLTHLFVTSINSLAIVVHYTKNFMGMLVDLPLRIALAIPASFAISFGVEALIEPIKLKESFSKQ